MDYVKMATPTSQMTDKIMYSRLPWYRRYLVPLIMIATIFLMLFGFGLRIAGAYEYNDTPLTMTAEEIDELYNYVRQLEMENSHLKDIVNLSESTLIQASEFAVKIDTQTQALIVLYEHKEAVMDRMMGRYETALSRLDTLTDKYERRIVSLERENNIWKILGIVGVAAGASSW